MATPQQLRQGRLFPPLSDIREVEVQLAAVLAGFMVDQGLGTRPAGFSGDWEGFVRGKVFAPSVQQQQVAVTHSRQLVLSRL